MELEYDDRGLPKGILPADITAMLAKAAGLQPGDSLVLNVRVQDGTILTDRGSAQFTVPEEEAS